MRVEVRTTWVVVVPVIIRIVRIREPAQVSVVAMAVHHVDTRCSTRRGNGIVAANVARAAVASARTGVGAAGTASREARSRASGRLATAYRRRLCVASTAGCATAGALGTRS